MYKFVLIVSLFMVLLFLLIFSVGSSVYVETLGTTARVHSQIFIKNVNSCTERCHVNYMAYESEFKVSDEAELFRHRTHLNEQNSGCTSCHDDSEVNTERHGRLTIGKENCLECHHVELKESECRRCHQEIDESPMKYKEERFVHGFTVESDVDCGLCHVKDPHASLKEEEINCVKCHHTTPDLECIKCHRDDMEKYFDTEPPMRDGLSWTVAFKHSQHTEKDLLCTDCHLISHDNDTGVLDYNLNCSKCHHDSENKTGCTECHREPSAYLRGELVIKGVKPMPDMMSKAVKCEDCHKFNGEKLKFRGVEKYCIECHNEDYGKLYNAWKDTIKSRLIDLNIQILSSVEDRNISHINESETDGDKNKEEGGQSDMNKFIDDMGVTVDIITKFGSHNFNLTRILLDKLEEKIKN